jgi:hypothetical protein
MRNRAARGWRAPTLRSQAFPDQQCGIAARKSGMMNVGVALRRVRVEASQRPAASGLRRDASADGNYKYQYRNYS